MKFVRIAGYCLILVLSYVVGTQCLMWWPVQRSKHVHVLYIVQKLLAVPMCGLSNCVEIQSVCELHQWR